MARPTGRPKGKNVEQESSPDRVTIINLKGNAAQAQWLEAAHKSTHISKSVIVRLGLSLWGEKHGLPPFPPLDGAQD